MDYDLFDHPPSPSECWEIYTSCADSEWIFYSLPSTEYGNRAFNIGDTYLFKCTDVCFQAVTHDILQAQETRILVELDLFQFDAIVVLAIPRCQFGIYRAKILKGPTFPFFAYFVGKDITTTLRLPEFPDSDVNFSPDRYFMRPHQFMPMVCKGNWVAKTYSDFTHKPWRCCYVPDVPELPCVKPVTTVVLVCFLLSLTKEKRRTFRTAIGEGSLIGCYDAKLALDAYWKDIGKPSLACKL